MWKRGARFNFENAVNRPAVKRILHAAMLRLHGSVKVARRGEARTQM